ncbi:EamA family transporter [Chelativorans sp. ZYF759]|uniref:DMT family transporter n=1 Tax=Chelativorans sp. ZYF759 TaxID=2692213 RepID=UPI0016AC1D28|nr:DMT family transporter [Chelativorans sp. ZYF759]NMG40761.1 EamA family transporter [Chelativorans sp. ZYF759]
MESLHSPIRAALWMGASIACFIVMSVAGRVATAELDVFQVMLIRSVIGFFMLLPLVHLAGGLRAMGTARPWQHIGRNAAHFAGQFAWLLALGMIPLAQLVAIEFTQPFWTALLALLVLGERMTWRKVCALLFGIAGVLVIVRPGSGPIEPGHLVMLAGAVFFGVSVVMVKLLTRSDSVVKIIFWMLVIQTAIGIVPGLWVWQPVPVEIWPALLVVAFTGTFSHYCMARALVHAEATVVVPMDFLRVPLMALVGWAIYAEQLDIYTGTGALLILLGNLFTIRFRRRKALPAEAP